MRSRLSQLSKRHRYTLTSLFLSLIFLLGMGIGCLSGHGFSENSKFQSFTKELFKKEVSGNTLTLHYTLADPEAFGISGQKASLGTMDTDTDSTRKLCKDYLHKLKAFDSHRLSRQNNITQDTLLLYFHTQLEGLETPYLDEPLGPSLGMQAQLPVLLAEYAFHQEQDITDYLNLLADIPSYFDSILKYEKQKSQKGLFMSDAMLDRIQAQCRSFIQDPDSNYMLSIFAQKLDALEALSDADKIHLNQVHRQILIRKVIPAYQALINGLEAFRGTGRESCGLSHYPGGTDYYCYLLKSQTGVYEPVAQIRKRLLTQLQKDSAEVSALAAIHPSLLTDYAKGTDLPSLAPQKALLFLQDCMQKDFPSLGQTSYQIRYVHKSMEKYLSPAFYLTPPIDTKEPNVIYINQAASTTQLELFTTLAHEGFPGHLYQTQFFSQLDPDPVRSLFNSGGYVEGWATYVESYAYQYAATLINHEDAESLTRLTALNRSINLCLYSLVDIGIHYQGWSSAQTADFLKNFGIRDASAVSQIYQYITETPGNYLKYYVGYLNFLDLKDEAQKENPEAFDLKQFHSQVLQIGPVPFPVLKKYL